MSTNLDKGSAKVLVLGDSGVGKSSLIHLICHSSVLSSPQWTIGCSIEVKLYENFILEFWDIGGSRGHKIARSFLYQDYHGIILVFDATNKKSRSNLTEWLSDAVQKTSDGKDMRGPESVNVPVITISTKKDLLPSGTRLDQTTRSLSDLYGDNNGSRQHSSVVNFNLSDPSVQSYPYRRHNQLSSSFSSTHSNSDGGSYEPLLENQMLYVNTQDVLSFHPGSENHQKLNDFFKQVVDGRNRKFYNKFAT